MLYELIIVLMASVAHMISLYKDPSNYWVVYGKHTSKHAHV